MFWITRALSVLGGLFGGFSKTANMVLIAAVLLGGVLVFGYQLGSSDTAQSYEVAQLKAQLEAERQERRRTERVKAELEQTIADLEAKQQEIEHDTPIPTGSGADCPVGPDFVREVLAGYEGSD